MSLQQPITISPDKYNLMLAETAHAAFLDQNFINTMRFSELNGDEEYDNTFLYAVWHLYLEGGLQQMMEYNEWILRELETMRDNPTEYLMMRQMEQLRLKNPEIVLDNKTPNLLPLDKSVLMGTHTEEEMKTLSIQDYNDAPMTYLVGLLDDKNVKQIIPYDQRARIFRYFLDYYKARQVWTQRPQTNNEVSEVIETDDSNRVIRSYELPSDSALAISLVRNYMSHYNQNLVDFITFYDCHIAILNGRMARARGHKKELLELSKTAMERKPSVEIGGDGSEEKKHWYKPW